jgi:comEA protein
VLKKVLNSIYHGLSVFGLTQQEAYFVLVVILLSLIGSVVSLVKPYYDPGVLDSVFSDKMKTFRLFSESIKKDSLDVRKKDSLMVVLAGDEAKVAHWKSDADSLKKILARHPSRESVDSFLTQINDAPVKTVNLNEATLQELNALPGIGPKLAERIIDYRNTKGSFRAVEDIQRVKGIGKKMFAKIKPFIDIH